MCENITQIISQANTLCLCVVEIETSRGVRSVRAARAAAGETVAQITARVWASSPSSRRELFIVHVCSGGGAARAPIVRASVRAARESSSPEAIYMSLLRVFCLAGASQGVLGQSLAQSWVYLAQNNVQRVLRGK